MQIRNVRHKGLRRFVESGDRSGLPGQYVEKIRNMVSFLQDMGDAEELYQLASWRAHRLLGDRAATWSLTVSRNWRITFQVDEAEKTIFDLDFEDYH